ncbi:MAG: DUF2806 domain-containing protein, partial [Phyllobacterium sp.]|uniref:DUF2806 domain-containing protein n=1 Tax=Phyllobacterium sp. TaxID=1871046 RepID=UPI0030F1B351
PEFSDRFERYAEDASSEQLRERWGKVLASEIKKPGTFSGKVLRVIDELDSQTASLFERLMQYRIREALLKPIMPELNFADTLALVSAGLIVEPGLSGHVTEWTEMRDNQGSELWVYGFGKFALGLKKDSPITYGTDAPIEENNGKPANPVFLLTDVGRALSTIISQDESKAGFQFLKKLKGYQPTEGVRFYVHDGGNNWKLLPTPE